MLDHVWPSARTAAYDVPVAGTAGFTAPPGHAALTDHAAQPLFVAESETRIRLWYALPPLDPGSLRLEAWGATLSVRGMAFRPETGADEKVTFGRTCDLRGWWTFQLPQPVEQGEIEAIYANGLLEVRIERAAANRAATQVPLKAA